MDAIQFVEKELDKGCEMPNFRAGDNIAVSYKISEGDKTRIQVFRGDVLQVSGTGLSRTFTVRKMSSGVGVERVFPMNSPHIAEVKVLKRGNVRRSRIYYLRQLVGKKARIKERR